MVFASQLPDTNGNGIPDIPERYQHPNQTSEQVKSINPVTYFKGTNGVNILPATLLTLATGGILLLVL